MDENRQSKFKLIAEVSKTLNLLDEDQINTILNEIAKEAQSKIHFILSENQKDLQRMDSKDPRYDRLLLNEERMMGIISDIRKVASLPSPIGRNLGSRTLENGLKLTKRAVPFGVIGVIYESRPNVNFDVFSLCFKSGNACILKGGSDAQYSNAAIVTIIRDTLDANGVNPNVCTLLPNDRKATEKLLQARDYVDLIIPRGGKNLIEFVRNNSKVPIIETGAGVCHTYLHKDGDREKCRRIITNAKTRRVSVCNSLDCFIIHKDRLDDLSYLCQDLADRNVTIYADKLSLEALDGQYSSELLLAADAESYGIEFLDYKMSIKTVYSLDEAIEHINTYGSKHSEAIIAEDDKATSLFFKLVDAACIYSNASTAFTDGGQFGLGAEIGISTQKMHARGPMALQELCTYKWIVEGDGQIRNG